MIDMNKYLVSIAYGKTIMAILTGETFPPSTYPNTDQGVLQWLLDDLDIDRLYNDPLALDIQLTLNKWIVDGEAAGDIRQQIVNVLADHFGANC